jgi:glycosyltransferase involved in cell wall biosynthesis
MKILYDAQAFNGRYGGVSRYFVDLMKVISTYDNTQVYLVAPLYQNEYVQKDKNYKVYGIKANLTDWQARFTTHLNSLIVSSIIPFIRPDVIHETSHPRIPIINSTKSVLITTVYDMIYELFPQFYGNNAEKVRKFKLSAVQRADHVICISRNTKNDLMRMFHVPEGKITVVHEGFSDQPFHDVSQEKPLLTVPYILFVGPRRYHKNFDSLLKAYCQSKNLHKTFKLLCFGGTPITQGELQIMREYNVDVTSLVHFKGDDKLLSNAYYNASAVIVTSLYEGFGNVAMEAMAHSCPVACSNTSSFPEVVGNAGEYFDPREPGDICDAVERIVFSRGRIHELRKIGKQRVKLFSLEKCAQETFNVYKRFL